MGNDVAGLRIMITNRFSLRRLSKRAFQNHGHSKLIRLDGTIPSSGNEPPSNTEPPTAIPKACDDTFRYTAFHPADHLSLACPTGGHFRRLYLSQANLSLLCAKLQRILSHRHSLAACLHPHEVTAFGDKVGCFKGCCSSSDLHNQQ